MDNAVEDAKRKKGSARGRGRGRGKRGRKGSSPRATKSKLQPQDDTENPLDDKETDRSETGNENEIADKDGTLLSPKLTDIDTDLTEPTDLTTSLTFGRASTSRLGIPLHDNKPLTWNHKVNLIGEKVVNPRIHLCAECCQPILIYGRLIPCKHVFCYNCAAKANDSICPHCNDKVTRIEKTGLGSVFMCHFDACKRTYLSFRDLQAHIHHRHMRRSNHSSSNGNSNVTTISSTVTSAPSTPTSRQYPGSGAFSSQIPVVSTRSNLITIPIQDENVHSIVNANSTSQTSSSGVSKQQASVSPFAHHSPQFVPHHVQPWPSIHQSNSLNQAQFLPGSIPVYNPRSFDPFSAKPVWPNVSPHGASLPHGSNQPFNRPFYP